MTETLLSVEDIHVGYGPIEAVRGVSLTVRRGEIVTVIGANGAGKTSTLMCISGMLRSSQGRIRFDGEDITDLPAHALVGRGLAQVPEGRRIFPRLTVLENLELGAYLRRDKPGIRADFDKVFHLFPILRERQSQAGGTLSGGEQQMLAIGRALMSRPKLLLMDEPSMGVAPILTARIFERIRELNKEGMTILLVEQNAHLALQTAQRGYVIEIGQIVLEDDASRLLANPRVREAYLGDE
ncbi:MAG: ABC transporter ATP-binding protein [Candidatus Hydrogenedentes bacterium]|nr:ABC transporter ATP-binding protein [Candidatus Hydrogenedentota bacterium]